MVNLVRYLDRRYGIAGTRRDWMTAAACLSGDPELFFPAPSDAATIAAAKAVCQGCPVRRTCEEYAVPIPGLEGIWGGLTERQRTRLRNGA